MTRRLKALLRKHVALLSYFQLVCTPGFEVDDTYSTYGHLEDGSVPDFEGRFVDFARNLEAAGLGSFKLGRRGYPSRFEWGRDVQELAREIIGQPEPVETALESDLEFHMVSLPRGRTAHMNLPNDLAGKEVEVVIAYLRALTPQLTS